MLRLAYSSICTVCDKGKCTAICVLAICSPGKFQEVEAPRFKDIRYVKLVRLSALCTAHLSTPGNIPCPHFFKGPSWPQGHCVAGKVMSVKNLNDTIWNRTHNQLVAHSEQTEPLCAPQFMIMLVELTELLCLELKCLCNKTATGLWQWTMPKVWFWVSYILFIVEIYKYILEKLIYTV